MRFSKGHLRLSHKEIWNAGEQIASCIYDGLLQFKNSERVGYPVDLTADKWNEYLDKMLFSFKEISTRYKNDPYEIYSRENLKKGFYNIDYNNLESAKLPDDDAECVQVKKESEMYFKKIKEGLNLFSKYYMDLWD